jgi:lipid-binding SYLF domain-containing protein
MTTPSTTPKRLSALAALLFIFAAGEATAAGDSYTNKTDTNTNTNNNSTTNTRTEMKQDATLDKSVTATLSECQRVSTSCAQESKNAAGILVFPEIIKADLIVGGAGGKGALIENGRVTGYYSLGAASAGLQAGVENSSQVYIFRTKEALADLKNGSDWKAGASAGATLVTADASANAATGNVLAYVFDAKGLHAGVSLDVFNIWETGKSRPSSSRASAY